MIRLLLMVMCHSDHCYFILVNKYGHELSSELSSDYTKHFNVFYNQVIHILLEFYFWCLFGQVMRCFFNVLGCVAVPQIYILLGIFLRVLSHTWSGISKLLLTKTFLICLTVIFTRWKYNQLWLISKTQVGLINQ